MTTDLHTRLRAADPARDVQGYADAELTRRAHAILAAPGDGRSPVESRRSRPRRLLLAVPVAAAVAAVLVVAPSLTGSRGGASAEAAALLNTAASSITTVDPAARPGQWWEVTTTGFNLATFGTSKADPTTVTILEGRSSTQYVAVDGTRPTVTVSGPATLVRQLTGDPVTAADLHEQLTSTTETSTSNLAPNDVPGTWQTPNAAFLAALPRDPQALRQRLYDDTAGHGRSTDGEVVVYVADVLRSGLVPADLRAALYRVLATVPGVEVTARRAAIGTDSGVAFGRYESVDGTRQEIVIDTATGDLVGEREVAVTALDGIPAGTVIGQTAVTRVLVDAVPAATVAAATVYQCGVSADGATQCTG